MRSAPAASASATSSSVAAMSRSRIAAAWWAVRRSAALQAQCAARSRRARSGPLYKNFVQRCLRERGYDVIGWK